MPKLVPTIAITVIRDGKRVTPKLGTAFDFTADEVKSVTLSHATAFRKPINETGDDESAPDGNAGPTANTAPARPASEKAAKKDSQSAKARKTKKETGQPQDTGTSDDDADEDEDI